MATNACKKINKLKKHEALKEMIQLEDGNQTNAPRYQLIKKRFPSMNTEGYRKHHG